MTMGNGTNGSAAAAALLLTRPPPPLPLQSKQSINPNRFSYGDFAAINHYYDGGGPVDSTPDGKRCKKSQTNYFTGFVFIPPVW